MTFSLSRDLGDLGSQEGPPLSVEWSMWRNLAIGLPWLAVLLLLFRGKNANAQAWAILIPIGVLVLPLVIAAAALTMVPGEMASLVSPLMAMIESIGILVAAWSALWLLSDLLGSFPRVGSFGMAVAIVAAMILLGASCSSGLGLDGALVGVVLGNGFVAGILLLAMVLAGALCRKNYRPGAFCLWLYAWVFISVMVLIVGFMGLVSIPMVIAMGEPGMALMMLAGAVVYALVGGGVLAGLITPFLLLTLMSPLYRARFFAIFRLNGMEIGEGVPEERQVEATTPSTDDGSGVS